MKSRSYTLIFSVALLSSMLFVSFFPLMDNADCKEEDMPTRANEGVVERDFDVQFMLEPSTDPLDPMIGEKWAKMSPGGWSRYWVIISNIGSYNDSYEIRLLDPQDGNGWDWYFSRTKGRTMDVDLVSPHLREMYGGVTFRTFMIDVICPTDASNRREINMTVLATSKNASESNIEELETDQDKMFFVVGHVSYLELKPHHPVFFHAQPGEWMSVPINITNLGNKDFIDVALWVEEDDLWRTSYRDYEEHYSPKGNFLEYNWTEKDVRVKQGETISLELSFRDPGWYFGQGDIFQFRYLGRIKNSQYWMDSGIITLFLGDPFRYYEHFNFTKNETEPEDNETIENRSPIPIISSPESHLKYLDTSMIMINGSNSVDPDGDNLTYLWYSDLQGYLGTGPVFEKRLEPGDHRIWLYLNDGKVNVSTSVNISVLCDLYHVDTDTDGIPDLYDNDDDNDGLLDFQEDPNQNGVFEPHLNETDPKEMDTDGDGVSDLYDQILQYDPPSPTSVEESGMSPLAKVALAGSIIIPLVTIAILVVILVFVLRKKKV